MRLALDPNEVNSMVSEIKSAIQSYNTELQDTVAPLSAYIAESGLSGAAYTNSKHHMEDHITVIGCAIIVNEEFMSCLDKLSATIGSERLIEYELNDDIAKCDNLIKEYKRQKKRYQALLVLSKVANASLDSYCYNRIETCDDMIASYNETKRIANEKIERLYEINRQISRIFDFVKGFYGNLGNSIQNLNSGRGLIGFLPRKVDAVHENQEFRIGFFGTKYADISPFTNRSAFHEIFKFINSIYQNIALTTQNNYSGGPTELEAAYLADHIYDAKDDDKFKKLDDKFNGWRLEDIKENSEGLKIGVYYRDVNGKREYTIVNEGSKNIKDLFSKDEKTYNEADNDWVKNNLTQPYGRSQDMIDSINFAKEFVDAHPDASITFVGHSKGGAEAMANAVVTNKNVITFNPARTAFSQYGLDEGKYTANSKRYVVDGELLNGASTLAVGDAATLGEAKMLEGKGNFAEKHYMKTVIESLEKGQ